MPKVDQDGRPLERRETSPEKDRVPGPVFLLLQLLGLGGVVLGLAIIGISVARSGHMTSEEVKELAFFGGGIALVGLVALAIVGRSSRRRSVAASKEDDWRSSVDEAVSRTCGQLLIDFMFWSTVAALAIAGILHLLS